MRQQKCAKFFFPILTAQRHSSLSIPDIPLHLLEDRSLRPNSQDHDGSHIKGLLLNMVAHWWPSLLKLNGFIREFITPIVKVWKGDVKKSFFTVGEYEEWKKLNNNGKGRVADVFYWCASRVSIMTVDSDRSDTSTKSSPFFDAPIEEVILIRGWTYYE